MKPRTLFATLPKEDRQLILNLCSNHTYDQAVLILEKPRSEGGLAITTSKSALCRFFTTSHPEPSRAVLAQYATALQVRHEQDGYVFLGAIRAGVEARVLETLKSGKSLADMEKDFKMLKIAQDLFMADSHWRVKNPRASRAAHQAHLERCAQTSGMDFVPNEEVENQIPSQLQNETPPSDFDLESDCEDDDFMDPQELARHIEAHDRAILARRAAAASNQPPHSTTEPSKTPEIPQIPLNPTSTKPPMDQAA